MMMKSKRIRIELIVLAGMVVSLFGCGSPAVVPKNYTMYKAPDGSFRIDYPSEWTAAGGGKSGTAWAKFTSGNSEIKVSTSLMGSLMADIAKIGNDPRMEGQTEEDTKPVAIVHEQEREDFEEENGVKEQKPAYVPTKVIDARKAEFSGSSTFGGSVHGYRVTALTADLRVRIICRCPEREWESLKPAFDKIIESLGPGR
jgi:hypothetical protein